MDDVAQLEDFAELGPALSSLIDVKGDYLRDLSRSLSGQSGT